MSCWSPAVVCSARTQRYRPTSSSRPPLELWRSFSRQGYSGARRSPALPDWPSWLRPVLGYLKLAALLHPAKAIVDAVFQAHRLDWVLSGRYFFTQPLPDGVAFPYAIGLFVMAAPWAAWTTDHVLLLRIVVITTDAVAGLLLYPLIVRWWGDRRAALAAVVLYHLVPLPYVVIGNANLTNAFAQAVALMAIAAAISLRTETGRSLDAIGAAPLIALAFLSHVRTLALLAGTLVALALVSALFGGLDGRRVARGVMVATLLALVAAAGLYYRHFPEVYERAFERVRATGTTTLASPPAQADPDRPAVLVRSLAWHERAADAGRQVVDDVGWPILFLALAGAWRAARAGSRDRLSLGLLGWVGAWVGFLLVGTLTRVETEFQRYAAEFIGRVNLAGYPAVVILAARGLGWCWSSGASRGVLVASVGLLAAAVFIGVSRWIGWIG